MRAGETDDGGPGDRGEIPIADDRNAGGIRGIRAFADRAKIKPQYIAKRHSDTSGTNRKLTYAMIGCRKKITPTAGKLDKTGNGIGPSTSLGATPTSLRPR